MSECLSSEELAALATGRLPAPRTKAADAHLDGCERCARELLQLLRVSTVGPTFTPPGGTRAVGVNAPVGAEAPGRYEPVIDREGRETELGRGGIGRVLLVVDTQLGRQVAMKLLLPSRTALARTEDSAALSERFLREARVTGQLEHPAIVPVHELGMRPDGSLYYTMRRVRGRTLAQAVVQAGSLDARLKLLPHVLAACQAIAFAHSRHVVHRDLKPQNVMVDRFGETYVVDWGLARVRGEEDGAHPSFPPGAPNVSAQVRLAPDLTTDRENVVVGTPAYMAPEQLAGRLSEVDERSDVWGLGAILYEVLTGEVPRQLAPAGSGRPFTEVRSVLQREKQVPKELAAICDRALADDKAARYPSAAELAADLDAWMHGRRVGAYEYRAWDLLGRFVRQHRAAVTVALVALIGLSALAISSVRRVQAERNDARELADLLLVDVSKTLEPVPGSLPVLDALTRRAVSFYERVGREETLSVEKRAEMARAVQRLAQLNFKLGRFDEGMRLAQSCNTIAGAPELARQQGADLLAESVGCERKAGTGELMQGHNDAARRHFDEAVRRVALAPKDWTTPGWLSARSLLESRLFRQAYDDADIEEAIRHARNEVALDEQLRAQAAPGDVAPTRALAQSLTEYELSAFYGEDQDDALRSGEKAIDLLRAVPDGESDVHVMLGLAGAYSQHQQLLLLAGRDEEASKLLLAARRTFERLLVLEPNTVMALGDYGTLLLRAGELEAARAVFQRADELGARSTYQTTYMEVLLLLGRVDEVLARRSALEQDGTYQAMWVLAVALAMKGQLSDAAAAARRAAADASSQTEWRLGGVSQLAKQVPGPVGEAIARFGAEYERAYLGEGVAHPALEHFAQALEVLAADAGVKR